MNHSTNLKVREAYRRITGVTDTGVVPAQEVLDTVVQFVRTLADAGKTDAEIAEQIGYSHNGIRSMRSRYGIKTKTELLHGVEVVCPCGCGRSWTKGSFNGGKKFFNGRICRRRYYKKLRDEGKLEPTCTNTCLVCGKTFPIYRELDMKVNTSTCSVACGHKIPKSPPKEDTSKRFYNNRTCKMDADRETRHGYCKRWEGRSLVEQCQRYPETCGEGCYREKKGRPTCYAGEKVEMNYRSYAAVNIEAALSM